jgi:hypothetical protein
VDILLWKPYLVLSTPHPENVTAGATANLFIIDAFIFTLFTFILPFTYRYPYSSFLIYHIFPLFCICISPPAQMAFDDAFLHHTMLGWTVMLVAGSPLILIL